MAYFIKPYRRVCTRFYKSPDPLPKKQKFHNKTTYLGLMCNKKNEFIKASPFMVNRLLELYFSWLGIGLVIFLFEFLK